MNPQIVQAVIRRFGSQCALAAAIEVPQPTIAWWKKRGSIPDRHKVKILQAAQERGIPLTADDFLAVPTDKDAGQESAA